MRKKVELKQKGWTMKNALEPVRRGVLGGGELDEVVF
jgi:hypothetical protein